MNTNAGLDGWLFAQVNAFARVTGWLHAVLYGYATYGIVLFAVILLAGWWLARRDGAPKRMAGALWAVAATLLAVGINQPIVAAIHEARPYTTLHGILVLADPTSDPSFPSDHATMAGAVAAGMFLVHRRLAWVATAAALLIAFSRVYIAAHFPQDVAAGLALGAAVTLLGYRVLRRPLTAIVLAARSTWLRPVLTGQPSSERASSQVTP